MATYAELQATRERAARTAAQDRHMASLHARFDADKDTIRMKYERPSFTVVTASEAFRAGWDAIFAKEARDGVADAAATDRDRDRPRGRDEVPAVARLQVHVR